MLNKFQFISSAITKTLSPYLSSFPLQKSIQPIQLLSFPKISSHPFCSFRSLNNNNYKDDLAILQDCSSEELAYANEVLDKYSTSQDLKAFNQEERRYFITLLQFFAKAYLTQGNDHKGYSYIKEAEQALKELEMNDTFLAANNHYIKTQLCLDLIDDSTIDIQYHCDEIDRICKLLNEDPDARSLRVHNLETQGKFHFKRNQHDKALEFFNQVFENTDQVNDEVLPHLLVPLYYDTANIYKMKGDATKAIECYNKGLEIAVPNYGENSNQVFFFYFNLAEVLSLNDRFQEALPFLEKSLQVAPNIFPPNHSQIAWCYYLLANILVNLDDPAKALEAFRKAIKIFEMEPQEHLTILSDAYFLAAKMHHKMGNALEAFPFTVESRKLLMMSNDPNIVQICLGRGKEIGEKGTPEEYELYLTGALDAYKKTPKPQDREKVAEANFLLGSLYFEMKIWKRALGFLKESEQLYQESSTDPHSLYVLNSLMASLHTISKDYDQSAKYLLKTIEACEANGYIGYHQQAYYYLGKVYRQSGMTEKAKEADEKYRSLCKTNNQEGPDVQFGVFHAQQRFFPIETLAY